MKSAMTLELTQNRALRLQKYLGDEEMPVILQLGNRRALTLFTYGCNTLLMSI